MLSFLGVLGLPWNYLYIKIFFRNEIGGMFSVLLIIPFFYASIIGIVLNFSILAFLIFYLW